MKRAIIAPADLAGPALDELKGWLAITTSGDDATLETLLRGALDMCEGFTGQMPLECTCEEILPASGEWQVLSARPVQAVTAVDGIPAEGPRLAFNPADYAIELDADGGARVRIIRPGSAGRIAVRFTAGMAAGWPSLPGGIRHGLIRLAAHGYRQRDQDALGPVPPAAVAALWRPWRRLRLA